ncbi:MAG: nucleotidyltransferase domain-containing protein [Gammaproteobacteria bacterium]|nr:nucleotidyltransferase domain-containing protein [Gammaproteobacteria bacterium]
MTTTSVSDALFTKTQQRVLGLLYGQPGKSFYTNEIVRRADMGRGTIRRELDRLVSAGLILISHEGNQNHYQANPENPIYSELVGIARKTFGIADVIRMAISPLDAQIKTSFIYGSIAKETDTAHSDIDLLVVSDSLAYGELMEVLSKASLSLRREINPSIYSVRELKEKLKQGNAFITRILEQPKIWVKGSEDDLGTPGKSGQD